MNVAFLIIAHDQPNHLAKLAKSLTCDWARIFIHIDRNVDISIFKKTIPENKNIIFLNNKNRIGIHWGGFGIVKATLNLIHVSLQCNERFDRYCLLSGSDYPIKPLSTIKSSFDSENEFIRVARRLSTSDNNTHIKNVSIGSFMDNRPQNNRQTLQKLSIPRRIYNKITLYHGSQWWALSHKSICYILEFLERNPDYIDFHKFTHCPDEIFFHSIIKNSPYDKFIVQDFERREEWRGKFADSEHGCHYIDWTSRDVKLPKVLDTNDISQILTSKALFARKFRENVSGSLLQLLQG